MFDYCKKCIKEHKGKICECKYNEVCRFIELLNFNYEKNFILKSCPEHEDDIYTADLKFTDEILGENIYIEVKEVKIGYKPKGDIGSEKGQMILSNCINIAIDRLEENRYKIMNDYIISIPKIHMDQKDGEQFINQFSDFLNENISENKRKDMYFTFIRSNNNEKININISLKDDETKRIGDKLLYKYNTESKDVLGIINNIGDLNNIIDGVKKNIVKTEKVKNKFPKSNGKRVLLNILRFPFGEEIFFNIFLNENFSELINRIEMNACKSIDESYLLYYFEDEFYYDNNEMKSYKKLLVCIKILGNLIEDYLISFEE